MDKTICELFAGVGGFRLGFERLKTDWKTVWFSQWEPYSKAQWAHDCYVQHFGDSVDLNGEYHTNDDISTVNKHTIPDHTLLVGGFPCQDYSVAHTLSTSEGIEGKKGVLWWQIRDVLIAKKPPFCLLENVDRLITSPSKQYGRDFGIILACFAELGYSVEWRIVKAARYGAAQRRHRTFIFAYRDDTVYGCNMSKCTSIDILKIGFMSSAFPILDIKSVREITLPSNIAEVSDYFTFRFENTGYMHNGLITTARILEARETPINLGDILQRSVDSKYYIQNDLIPRWEYLKGAKKIPRVAKNGYSYIFSEGAIPFPDPLDRPGRTMLTSEGSINRTSHVVKDIDTGKFRVITPVETERMQGFDDDWTNIGMSDRQRYFCMGNALVVPMVTRMGKILDRIIEGENCEKRA